MLLFRDLIRSQMQVISILRIIFIQVVCLLQWWRDKPAWKVFRHAKEGSQRCFRCVSLFNTSTTVFSLRRSLQEVLDTDGSRCWIPQSGRGEISPKCYFVAQDTIDRSAFAHHCNLCCIYRSLELTNRRFPTWHGWGIGGKRCYLLALSFASVQIRPLHFFVQ